MRRLNGVLAMVSALALLTAASGAMAQTADQMLVQMLLENGKLTKSQADRINAARPEQRLDVLTQMLRDKGDLTDQQLQRINAAPRPVVVAAPAPGAVGAAPPLIALAAPRPGESPFAFRVGGVNFQIGGFLDFETIIRSSNTGASTATNFGAVPFSNTVAGHQRDLRLTAQNTQLSLKATSNFWGNDVTGYVEMDFNGNDAANVFVNSNSHTARLRLAYANVMRGPWEFTAGQLWSWVTPNRVGLSADPRDVFTTYNFDQNYIAGLNWARQAGIRAAWHPNQNFALGLSVENPDQYVGVGEVIFPFGFNAQLGGQFDAANQSGTPNFAPDVIPKVAFDASPGGMHIHAEALGLFRSYRMTILPIGAPTFTHDVVVTKAGGVGVGFEPLPGLTFVGNGIYGEAIGRYAGALGPDVVVQPFATDSTGTHFSAQLSPVSGASGVLGVEWKATPDDLLAAYVGASFFHRNSFSDVTSPLVVKPIIGFGGTNSPNSANRLVKELSFDYIRTIWADPQYGMLKAGLQFSTVVREPWFVASGAPKDAISHMGFVDLRYILP